MATLHLVKKFGDEDFYKNNITYVIVDMLDGSQQKIMPSEIDRLIYTSFTDKIDTITIHTADKMMYKFKLSEWLITEAD